MILHGKAVARSWCLQVSCLHPLLFTSMIPQQISLFSFFPPVFMYLIYVTWYIFTLYISTWYNIDSRSLDTTYLLVTHQLCTKKYPETLKPASPDRGVGIWSAMSAYCYSDEVRQSVIWAGEVVFLNSNEIGTIVCWNGNLLNVWVAVHCAIGLKNVW